MNPQLAQILGTPQQQMQIQGPTLPNQQSQGGQSGNSLLDFLLPAGGQIAGGALGALVPGLGETGISEVGGAAAGGAAGKALANIIEGKQAGQGVGGEAVSGAIGGVTGLGIGKILGGVLGGAGEKLATGGLGFTRMISNRIAMENGEPVAATLLKHGLTGADSEQIIQKGIKPLQSSFDSIANNDQVPINHDILLNHAASQLDALKNSSVPSVKNVGNGVEESLGNIFDKITSGKIKTLADLNAERKAFDSATAQSQFGDANWGANRVMGDILRKSVQDTADAAGLVGENGQSLKNIGLSLKSLYNISDAAQKRAGMTGGGSPLSVTNLLLGGEIGGPALGMNPLLGAAMGFGVRKGLANPTIAGGASKGANSLSKILSNPVTGAVGGATGAGMLQSILSPQINNTPENQHTNNTENNQSNNSPSGVNLSQTGSNVNGQTASTGQTIKLSSGESLPAQLPDASSLGNTIPGQIYTPTQQASDIQKWTAYAAANPYNPGVQTQAQLQIQQAQQLGQLNDKITAINLQQLGLTPQQSGFIMTAAPTWGALTDLQQAMTSSGGSGIFNFLINSNPQVVAARASTDPQYGHMLQLMNYAKEEVGRMYSGGALTDSQLGMFQGAFSPSNSTATNIANLEQVMKQIYGQYQQYAPFFHLQTNASQGEQQTTQNVTGKNLLQFLTNKAAQ